MSASKTMTITTPEGVVFPLLLAGPVARFLALALDWLVISAGFMFADQIIRILELISRDVSMGVTILMYFSSTLFYFIILEWFWGGQTIGKKMLRLKVMDAEGLQLKFSQVAVRNILRAIDALPFLYMVGGIAALVSRKAQRFGDLAAGTAVVRMPKVDQPELTQILSGKFNSFKEYPHLCARLRLKVSPQIADLLIQALLNRNYFDPVHRVRVFEKLADYLKDVMPFPQQATDGISDEQYVKNTVEVLFNDKNSLV